MAIYAMADLHGQKDRYNAMLKRIQLCDSDTLYILGDVIDRGPHGIHLLLDLMDRPNAAFLLGNHERMMLGALEEMRRGVDGPITARWSRNGCEPTIRGFMRKTEAQRQRVCAFLSQAPLYLETQVNGRRFYLVHGMPYTKTRAEHERAHPTGKDSAYEDQFVWKRIAPGDVFFDDRTVLFGHTPTLIYQQDVPLRMWHGSPRLIGIDCGAAYPDEGGRLGCLCLDTMEEYYV